MMPDTTLRIHNVRQVRIGYVPYSNTLDKPGDKRRFYYYATKRNLHFEIADPTKEYDLVILTERADISVWSRYTKAKIVFDLIDSYLAIPRSDLKGLFRGLFKFMLRQSRYLQLNHWGAIESMCKHADAVVCTTKEQQKDISKFCSNIHVILDAHLDIATTFKKDYKSGKPFRLVWEGLPQNLYSLKLICEVLVKINSIHPIEMHVVTDRVYSRYLGKYGKTNAIDFLKRNIPYARFHEWHEEDCAGIICSCDLAVIPLALDDPFAAGKPENKLLLFWRMGMPVVTSASPAYERSMRNAGVNLSVKDEAGWIETISRLLRNEDARREVGTLGQKYVEAQFSESKLLEMWDSLFESLGFSFGPLKA
jgi:glycosyltransferase involved in cell wall biosynthesis